MDKKILIKPTISFFKSLKKCLLIDSNQNSGVPLLTLKIISKELPDSLNISFISPSEEYFNEIFPNLNGNIKMATNYALGSHNLSFFKLDKLLLKHPPEGYDIMLFYPVDEMKEKEIFKLIDKNKSLKKFILISNSMLEPPKPTKKLDPTFISLRPSKDTVYYQSMKQKISDFK